MKIRIEKHSLLDAVVFKTTLSCGKNCNNYPEWLIEYLDLKMPGVMNSDENIQTAIRNLLRNGGYKPSGRGKPSSEYLLRAVKEHGFPRISPVVDIGNLVSFHSGIPMSIIDIKKTEEPYCIRLGKEDENYIFNTAGQTIDLNGLLCFADITGPCANPVKDSMRTKLNEMSNNVVTVFWGSKEIHEKVQIASEWFLNLMKRYDYSSQTEIVETEIIKSEIN